MGSKIRMIIGFGTLLLSFVGGISIRQKKISNKMHADLDKQLNVMSKKEFESKNKK